jgi:putative transposase
MPQRLTYGEVEAIGGMVQSTEHRHLSIRGLALHAQRIGKVFAHPATWGKLIRERGWGRPRLRLYPAKPKVGLRTTAPNEAWHIDVTIIRLLDGTKAYVHAVIDNFSRKILAWTVASRLAPMNTHEVLTRAAGNLAASTKSDVFMDSGVENLNGDVDPLFEGSALHRVIAQVDVSFSNSLIEAWWRSQTSVAVSAPARQHRDGEEARRVLRDRAQRADPPRRVPRPDTGRGLLRSGRPDPR